MPDAVRLRDLDPPADRVALERLWVAAIGDVWPVLPAGLDLLRTGVVAEADGEPVGVVAVEAGQDRQGGVQLLLVDPAVRRRGIGTRLLEAGIERLRALGATTVALGSGGDDYLWPGVPEDLPGATGFLAARGWRFDDDVLDLIADLRAYQAPSGTLERAEQAGVTIQVQAGPGPPGPAPAEEVLAFEAENFPNWLRAFQRGTSPVLVARDRGGAVVGALLFRGPPDATIFTPMLGADAGTIGCVGVAAAARGAGVGSAMVARASELLRDAGTGVCHISWTEREWFYRRVGYLPWRRYHMARRPVQGLRPGRRHPMKERTRMSEEELRAAWVGEPPKLTGKIQVVDYDPAWPELFRREAARIRAALGERVVLLEHVGSTSVPGLAAKPIIDVLLIVPDSSDEPAWLPDLEAAGYVLVIREPDWYQHRCLIGGVSGAQPAQESRLLVVRSGDGPDVLPPDGQFELCRPWPRRAVDRLQEVAPRGPSIRHRRQGSVHPASTTTRANRSAIDVCRLGLGQCCP